MDAIRDSSLNDSRMIGALVTVEILSSAVGDSQM